MCHQALSTTGTVNVQIALKLFDTQISPILTYGCPIWGIPEPNKQVTLNQIPLHVNNLPVYIRQYVNFRCQTEITQITLKAVRKAKSPDTNSQATVTFGSLSDMHLFIALCAENDQIYKSVTNRQKSPGCRGIRTRTLRLLHNVL